jgi:putative ABC transport system permease protein
VLRLIVVEGMTVGLIRIGVGLLGGLVLGRAVAILVYGVAVRDPATFAGVAVTLAVVALAACIIPARRAARVDPVVALPYEWQQDPHPAADLPSKGAARETGSSP